MILKRQRYTAFCERVIDGDTIIIKFVCPVCDSHASIRLRLARIDAPELDGLERLRAVAARELLATFIEGKSIEIVPQHAWPDKYGRLLSEVFHGGVNVSNWMMESGAAILYCPKSSVE